MLGQIIKALILAMLLTIGYTFIKTVKIIFIPLIKVSFIIMVYMFVISFYYANKIIIKILSIILKILISIQGFIYDKYLVMYGDEKDE